MRGRALGVAHNATECWTSRRRRGVGAIHRSYETSLDRTGLAIGFGSVVSGFVAVALASGGGGMSGPLGSVAAFLIGAIAAAFAITGVAGPLWLVCHATNRRGPGYAALVGFATGLALLLLGQFGSTTGVDVEPREIAYRRLSTIAIATMLGVAAAVTSLGMWRVAYRRIDRPTAIAVDRST